MNLNDKLKQERTGLTASQYSDLQELFVDRYVDGMTTKDLVEYVYNDMMQYVENQPEKEFLDDCKDYGSKVDALVDSMGVTDQKANTTHRRKDMDLL